MIALPQLGVDGMIPTPRLAVQDGANFDAKGRNIPGDLSTHEGGMIVDGYATRFRRPGPTAGGAQRSATPRTRSLVRGTASTNRSPRSRGMRHHDRQRYRSCITIAIFPGRAERLTKKSRRKHRPRAPITSRTSRSTASVIRDTILNDGIIPTTTPEQRFPEDFAWCRSRSGRRRGRHRRRP